MLVTLHLNAELDALLRGKSPEQFEPSESGKTFQALLSEHALNPTPLFPAAADETFSGIWHVRVPERDAERIVEQVLRIPGVEAAYSKPAEGAPELP